MKLKSSETVKTNIKNKKVLAGENVISLETAGASKLETVFNPLVKAVREEVGVSVDEKKPAVAAGVGVFNALINAQKGTKVAYCLKQTKKQHLVIHNFKGKAKEALPRELVNESEEVDPSSSYVFCHKNENIFGACSFEADVDFEMTSSEYSTATLTIKFTNDFWYKSSSVDADGAIRTESRCIAAGQTYTVGTIAEVDLLLLSGSMFDVVRLNDQSGVSRLVNDYLDFYENPYALVRSAHFSCIQSKVLSFVVALYHCSHKDAKKAIDRIYKKFYDARISGVMDGAKYTPPHSKKPYTPKSSLSAVMSFVSERRILKGLLAPHIKGFQKVGRKYMEQILEKSKVAYIVGFVGKDNESIVWENPNLFEDGAYKEGVDPNSCYTIETSQGIIKFLNDLFIFTYNVAHYYRNSKDKRMFAYHRFIRSATSGLYKSSIFNGGTGEKLHFDRVSLHILTILGIISYVSPYKPPVRNPDTREIIKYGRCTYVYATSLSGKIVDSAIEEYEASDAYEKDVDIMFRAFESYLRRKAETKEDFISIFNLNAKEHEKFLEEFLRFIETVDLTSEEAIGMSPEEIKLHEMSKGVRFSEEIRNGNNKLWFVGSNFDVMKAGFASPYVDISALYDLPVMNLTKEQVFDKDHELTPEEMKIMTDSNNLFLQGLRYYDKSTGKRYAFQKIYTVTSGGRIPNSIANLSKETKSAVFKKEDGYRNLDQGNSHVKFFLHGLDVIKTKDGFESRDKHSLLLYETGIKEFTNMSKSDQEKFASKFGITRADLKSAILPVLYGGLGDMKTYIYGNIKMKALLSSDEERGNFDETTFEEVMAKILYNNPETFTKEKYDALCDWLWDVKKSVDIFSKTINKVVKEHDETLRQNDAWCKVQPRDVGKNKEVLCFGIHSLFKKEFEAFKPQRKLSIFMTQCETYINFNAAKAIADYRDEKGNKLFTIISNEYDGLVVKFTNKARELYSDDYLDDILSNIANAKSKECCDNMGMKEAIEYHIKDFL